MNYGFGNAESQHPTGNEEDNKMKTTGQPTSAELTEHSTKVLMPIYLFYTVKFLSINSHMPL